jgi:hypothetical protein
MKLHVCYGTFPSPRPGGHPCKNAAEALKQAGHAPEIKKAYGLGPLPDAIQSPQRKRIKAQTGSPWVPVLELDDGTLIQGSKKIVAWAEANPA